MEYIYKLKIGVRDYEVDAEGIVNNAVYLHYMEHTRHEFCRQAGITFKEMRQRGIDPVATKIEISYRRPLGLGDEMVSCLNLTRKGAQFIFQQDIYNLNGEIVTAAVVKIACLENGKLSRGDELAKAFAKYLPNEQ